MKVKHGLLIAAGVGTALYLTAVNGWAAWKQFLGGVANGAMGGYNFGVLDPDNWE